MFKKLKLWIVSIVACALLACGFAFMPLTASAENVDDTSEITSEIVESTDDNTTSEEIPETSETPENEPILSDQEKAELEDALNGIFSEDMTKDEKLKIILEIAGVFANTAGAGNEWDEMLFNLKTAASEEKVNGAIIVVIIQVVVNVGYIIAKLAYKAYSAYKKKKYPDTVKKDVADIKATGTAQNKAINNVGETVTEIDSEVKHENEKINALADAGTAQNAALRTLIRGTGIDKELKHEALRDLNKSDDLYETAKK